MEPQLLADRLVGLVSTYVPVIPVICGNPTKKTSSIKSEPPLDFPRVHLQFEPNLPATLFDQFRLTAASPGLTPQALDWLEFSLQQSIESATDQARGCSSLEEEVKSILQPCEKDYVIPDFVFLALEPDQTALVVELKNPLCGPKRFPEIVRAATEGKEITFEEGRVGYRSIVLKLAYHLRYERPEVEYALLLDMQNFVILRVEYSEPDNISTFWVSDCVPIDSKVTPFIPIITQILRSAHEDEVAQIAAQAPPAAPDPNAPQDNGSESGHSESGGSTSQAGPSSPTSGPGPEPYGTSLNSVNYASLAAILQETERLDIHWSIPRYQNTVWPTIRRPNSTIWHTALPKTKSAAPIRSPYPCTPPPSPPSLPSVPFKICLDRRIAYHVLGGHIPGVSNPLILKLLRTNRAEQELAIFRKLQHLAGTRIPGVLGVYLCDGIGYGPQAFIVQQDVGTTLDDFSTLNLDQMTKLYETVLQIHRAGVNHGDIAPRNVAINDNGEVAVFDFDLSEFHDCLGEASCQELKELRLDLGLKQKPQSSSSKSRAPSSIPRSAPLA